MSGRRTAEDEEEDFAQGEDRPLLERGEIVASDNGDFSFRIQSLIGEGKCCLVYSGEGLRDGVRVALKFYRKGINYEGAFQREMTILERFTSPNIVHCSGVFFYKGFRIQVLELLESNVRQIIFRNERRGLSPWGTQKFAKDILTALQTLHSSKFAHGDLKPANIMWCSEDGFFKLLDFGLSFHAEEIGLHQIQSSGYRAPECSEWNGYKERLKRERRTRLVGSFKSPSPNADPEEESSGIFSGVSNSSLNDVERLPPDGECRRRSVALFRAPSIPAQPGRPSDIWSFGCLLAEVFSGHKLYKANDKMAAVLKPHQMVEMRLGPTEISYDEAGRVDVFQQVKDLINRCLDSDPSERISSKDALEHEFLKRVDLIPTPRDMVIMPSRVLQFINILDENLSPEETEAVMNEIREEAEKYGEVTGMRSIGRHAYLEFTEASDAQSASSNLSGKKECVRQTKFVVVFYPLDLWRSKSFPPTTFS